MWKAMAALCAMMVVASCGRNLYDVDEAQKIYNLTNPVDTIEANHPWLLTASKVLMVTPPDDMTTERILVLTQNPHESGDAEVVGAAFVGSGNQTAVNITYPSTLHTLYVAAVDAEDKYTIVKYDVSSSSVVNFRNAIVIGEPIFVFHEFFEAFKKNFKQAVIVGIIDIALIFILVYNLNFYSMALMNTSELQTKIILALSVAMGFFVIMMHFYIYPQIVALNLKLPQIIKNSFILMVVGFKRSFAAFFAWFAIIVLMMLGFPYTMLVLPLLPFAWLNFIATFCAYPVIQKFIIDPFYESKGEKNPEYSRYETEEEAVFEDRGGFEEPTEIPKENMRGHARGGSVKVKTKGKVIK